MIWELIHRFVEMLNRTFENVSELDIMINSGLVRLVATFGCANSIAFSVQ
jgi:hypothetical protein